MRKAAPAFLLLVSISFLSCATQGTSTRQHIPAETHAFESTRTVGAPFLEVWDTLVGRLEVGPYVIERAEKASRKIIVAFSTETPETFVDCGRTHRTFAKGTEKGVYDYDTAASASYKESGTSEAYGHMPVTRLVDRKTALGGKIQVHVEPSNGKTKITVESTFSWTQELTGEYLVEDGRGRTLAQVPLQPTFKKCVFSTNRRGQFHSGDVRDPQDFITCVSNGKLEQAILDLAE